MNNKDKIILDLCGGTGAWSKPYKDNGYDVRNITLPKYDVRTYEPPVNVYGILAAPPCTEFSIASGNHKRDFREGMDNVIACLNIIWKCRYEHILKFWALENPRGFLRQFLGNPALTFDPWYYSDFRTKKTDIWGYFKIPKRQHYDRSLFVPPKGTGEHAKYQTKIEKPEEYKNLKLSRADIRAITPPGFALAFYKANK